jgi:streptogramin lyase
MIASILITLSCLFVPVIAARADSVPIITTYPVPAPAAYADKMARGSDGALWFTENEANKIGRISPDGTITEFQVPGGYSNPAGIAAGPDGALWFTSGSTIYRLTTDGVFTPFSAHGSTTSITSGPDGALWFTAQSISGESSIRRITTNGDVTNFPVPGGGPVPGVAGTGGIFMDIAAGSDGALWFTKQGGGVGDNAIGRMTTSGVYSSYPTPTVDSYPFGITAGPDGAVWFTETNSSRIGRIDTAGNITEYAIPAGTEASDAITSGPDDAVWFAGGGSYVGRVTVAGSVTEYPVTSGNGGALSGIASGSDGAVWFVQYGVVGYIGRINVPDTSAPVLVQAINAGGSASGSFAADTQFSGGAAYSTTAAVDTSNVTDPAPQDVYQSARYGNFTYAIPNLTPNASYMLRLDFNELYWGTSLAASSGVGSRVFNVSVNASPALTDFDIFKAAGGANKAVAEQIPVTADANGNVTVGFAGVTDSALVNGISIYSGTLPAQPTAPSLASARIAAGGNASGTFAADTDFSGGSTYTSAAPVDTSAVANPAPQSVYQSCRYGDFTYSVPNLTPNSNFKVRLHFNELYWGANGTGGGVGSRVFNVSINNHEVLHNFDIFQAAGGANTGYVQDFDTTTDSSGIISIKFTTVTDNAMVNGIEIVPSS